MLRLSPPRRGGWVSHCVAYYTYNMRKQIQNHIPCVIVTRMPLSRATWCASKHPKANVWKLYSFRPLVLLASKYPAFSPMPFPPPFFFLFLFSCLYRNHLHLYYMLKLFTCIVFQCFINKKTMRFRRKKGVFSLQVQIKFVSL